MASGRGRPVRGAAGKTADAGASRAGPPWRPPEPARVRGRLRDPDPAPRRWLTRRHDGGGQGECVAAIGLDALAGPLRDQRGSNDSTVMAQSRDLPMQTIAGRTCLVAEQKLMPSADQLADQAPHRIRSVLDLTKKAD